MVASIDSVIAANRFGLGARPGELKAIAGDPRGWLRAQLESPPAPPAVVQALDTSAEVLARFQSVRQQMRQGNATKDPVQQVRSTLGPAYRDQVMARYTSAAITPAPFYERLVHFWSNHFAVSADKPPVTALAGGLENEVIRPRVTGNFAGLLVAVEKHPAMLLYLDNQASIGPNSTLAKRAARFRRTQRKFDINENLGREILELHTLGVDGGYTQQDVMQLSRALTGWSVGGGPGPLREGTPGEFQFRARVHEPGTRTVLGRRYAQSGIEQGVAVLRDLAVHPSTARFLATKLVRHFIADEPPPAAVDRVSRAYLDSDGELLAAYTALIDSPEAWARPLAKLKTPHDYLVSGLRALDVQPTRARELIGSLMLLGQPAYRPGSPAGWPDTAADWDGADGLMKRIEWAGAVGRRAGPMVDPLPLGDAVLGPVFGEHSRQWIGRAESRTQALTLLLACPEFLRR